MEELFKKVLDAAENLKLLYLVIGGNALKIYLESRETKDLDICIERKDEKLWQDMLIGLGFNLDSTHKNFNRFSIKEAGDSLRYTDLFLVDKETFSKMLKNKRTDRKYNFPDIQSLIALKIFALREAKGRRGKRDLLDIIQLMKVKDLAI